MTFDKIQALIVEQLDVDPSMVTMDTDFMKDLEADSLDAVEIILGVEEEFLSDGFIIQNMEKIEKAAQGDA
jgi:acyl carrier protein